MSATTTVTLTQVQRFGRFDFHFNAEYLGYRSPHWQFNIKYVDLPSPTAHVQSRSPQRYTNMAMVYCITAALVLLLKDKQVHIGAEGFVWMLWAMGKFTLVTALLVGPIRWLEHRRSTLVPTAKGDVVVPHGANHDRILAELEAKRVASLRLALWAPDPANELHEEIAKYRWLLEQGAITQEECAQCCANAVALG